MVRVIHNDTEHREALAEVDRLLVLDPKDGTPEADELDLLALVVETYEKERYPIAPPDPIDAIRSRAAVAPMLEGVDAKAIADAHLDPETLDVAPPETGTKEEEAAVVAAKLDTVISVAEYEKLVGLREAVDAKPVEESVMYDMMNGGEEPEPHDA